VGIIRTSPHASALTLTKKRHSLPQVGVATLRDLRQTLDQHPALKNRTLLVSGDGSYINTRVLRHFPPRTIFMGRIRKDAQLCFPLPPNADLTRLG